MIIVCIFMVVQVVSGHIFIVASFGDSAIEVFAIVGACEGEVAELANFFNQLIIDTTRHRMGLIAVQDMG
jgi:hypothetical protein